MPALQDERLERFAHHYVERFNAIDAALAAGLIPHDAPNARGQANTVSNLALLRPEVGRRVRELNDAILRKVDASATRTMRELSRISFYDIRRLFDEDGRLLPIGDLDTDTARAIKAVKVERRRVKNGYETDLATGKRVPVYEDYETVEVKMHDKVATLGILAKHFKLVNDEGDGINALASALADRLRGARTRVVNRPPPQEIEDARIIHRDVPPDPAVDGVPPQVSQSGDGDRADPGGE